MIVYALDAIQNPVSLFEPVYSEGGDTLYVMDQISDRKTRRSLAGKSFAQRGDEPPRGEGETHH